MGLSTSRDDVSGVGGVSEAYSAYSQHARPTTPPLGGVVAGGASASHGSAKRVRGAASFGEPSARPRVRLGEDNDSEPDVVPVVLEWRYGGANVSVTGAWDGWKEAVVLSRDGGTFSAGASFIAVLYLKPGSYQYKYLVDGNWQCNPSVETQADALSNVNNIVHVTEPKLEFSASESEIVEPGSPLESYDFSCMKGEEARGAPPLLPDAALGNTPAPSTSYTLINHVSFSCNGDGDGRGASRSSGGASADSAGPVYMSTTFRYGAKRISATYIVARKDSSIPPPAGAAPLAVDRRTGGLGKNGVVGVPHLIL